MGMIPRINFRQFYNRFQVPVASIDCGMQCAPHNPSGKPFCCDICEAVPAAYHQEWDYLRQNTDLWHEWCGDGCIKNSGASADLLAETPEYMLLLACKGSAHCQREFRAMSCRQFPFFPYITADGRFLGLAYEWAFEPTCWVISNLGAVTETYQREFIQIYDDLFSLWPHDIESYAILSEDMRAHFVSQRRRIPILHRNGHLYLLSPKNERLHRAAPEQLKRFGPYRDQ